ncbi:MAG: hypothetical protein ABSC05_24250 [Candidatus Solibacter sp.]|jgi:hypothetical protein
MNIASYYRRVAGRQETQTAEPMKAVPSHPRDAVERANRLVEVFEDLASAAIGNQRPIAADPEPVLAPSAESRAMVKGRSFAERIGWWPAWVMGGLAVCLAAVPFLRVNRSTMPPVLTITGIVTDSLCGQHHPTGSDAACVKSCVNGGAKYALYDGASLYTLSDQRLGERFAARKVDVSGTLDRTTRTLRVASVRPVL